MNMSYCAFENTLADLRQCQQLLDDEAELSDTELQAAAKMFNVMEAMQGHWLSITHRARISRERRNAICPQCSSHDPDCLYCEGVGHVTDSHAGEWHRQNGK